MSPEIRVTHTDGSTDTLAHFGHEITTDLEPSKMDQARVFTSRDALNSTTLHETRDEVEVLEGSEVVFGGLLQQVLREGSQPELVVNSYEQYAKDARNTAAGQNYDNVDDSLMVEDAVDAVPQLSKGTIETVESPTSFVFSHCSQARKIRKVEETTSGETMYNADKTVDYMDRLGEDKTDTTISPSNRNLVGDPEVERRGVRDRTTHLTVLGSGEGEHQVSATLVPDQDRAPGGQLLPEVENPDLNYYTYDHPDWTPEWGDNPSRRIWDTYSNKDVTVEEAAASLGRSYINELNTAHISMECTVKGETVNLGDSFHLEYPDENVDHDLRAVKVVEKHTGEGGRRYVVTFSNRSDSITNPERKTVEDVERFNMAVEGTAVPINAGGARMPVDDNVDYEIQLYYPAEVVYEHRLNVRVIGLPYRAYSSGASADGGTHSHEITLSDHRHSVTISDHDHTVTIPSHSHPFTYGVPDHDHELSDPIRTTEGPSSGDNFHTHEFISREYDGVVDSSTTSSSTTDGGGGTTETTNDGGGTTTTTGDGGGTTETTSDESGEHTHDPEPGITAFQEYPSNCEVIVNGQEMGVSFGDGSGQFREVVDVQGALNAGQINTIRVTSDTLGHVQAYVEGDVYRQILGNG